MDGLNFISRWSAQFETVNVGRTKYVISQQTLPWWTHHFPFEHWSKAILGQDSTWMGDHLGTPGTAVKNQSWAPLREHESLTDGRRISFKGYRLWASLDCVPGSLLATAARWPSKDTKEHKLKGDNFGSHRQQGFLLKTTHGNFSLSHGQYHEWDVIIYNNSCCTREPCSWTNKQ